MSTATKRKERTPMNDKTDKTEKDFKLFDLDEQNESESFENLDIFNMFAPNTEKTQIIYNPTASQRDAEAKQNAVWKAYQEAISKAGQLMNEITKGVQSGENTEDLLLKAIECISLTTGDKVFYEINKDKLKNK